MNTQSASKNSTSTNSVSQKSASEGTVNRVRFQERQYLSTSDLAAEQSYRIATRWRHNIANHRWGIVTGLTLVLDPEQRGVLIQPGAAVDGYGREVALSHPFLITWEDIYNENLGDDELDRAIDVWVRYGRAAKMSARPGRWECGPGQHSHEREEASVLLTGVDPAHPTDPRHPPGVSMAESAFAAYQVPPDDPDSHWPVYVGQLQLAVAFTAADFGNPSVLVAKLQHRGDSISQKLYEQLPAAARSLVDEYAEDTPVGPAQLQMLAAGFNELLVHETLYDAKAFENIDLRRETRTLLARESGRIHLPYRNRLLLEDAYPAEIRPPLYFQRGDVPDLRSFTTLLQRAGSDMARHLLCAVLLFRDWDLREPDTLMNHLHRAIREPSGKSDKKSAFEVAVKHISTYFSPSFRERVAAYDDTKPLPEETLVAMLTELNSLLVQGKSLYDPKELAGIQLSAQTRYLLAQSVRATVPTYYLNRLLLEDVFASEIVPLVLPRYGASAPPGSEATVIAELNDRLLKGPRLEIINKISPTHLRPLTRALFESNPAPGLDLLHLNRLLLEDAYPALLLKNVAGWTAPPVDRAYIWLVGESIAATSRRPGQWAQLRVGSGAIGNKPGFAVQIPNEQEQLVDRLTISTRGTTILHNSVTATHDLVLAEAAPGTKTVRTPGLSFEPLPALPEIARPWQIYRVAPQDDVPNHQLRFELAGPIDEEDPTSYSLTVGSMNEDQKATSHLIVHANGDVEINGLLSVNGQISEGPIQPDPDDPLFADELLRVWLEALQVAADEVDRAYTADLELSDITLLTGAETGTTLVYEFTIKNTSKVKIHSLQITEIVTIDREVVRQRVITTPSELAPKSEPVTKQRRFDIPPHQDLADEDITIAIDVEGISGDKIVRASSRETTSIALCKLTVAVNPQGSHAFLGHSFQYDVQVPYADNTVTEPPKVTELALTATLSVGDEVVFEGMLTPDKDTIPSGDSAHSTGTFDIPVRNAWVGQHLRIRVAATGTRDWGHIEDLQYLHTATETSVPIDAGALNLALDVPDPVVITDPTFYQIAIQNSGFGAVTDIRLTATLTALGDDGSAISIGTQAVGFIPNLPVQAQETLTIAFPDLLEALEDRIADATEWRLAMVVTAHGFGRGGSRIQATGELSAEHQPLLDAGGLVISNLTIEPLFVAEPIIEGAEELSFAFTVANPADVGTVLIAGFDFQIMVGESQIELPPIAVVSSVQQDSSSLEANDSQTFTATLFDGATVHELSGWVGQEVTIRVGVRGTRQKGSAVEDSASTVTAITGGRLALTTLDVQSLPVTGETMRYWLELTNDGYGDVEEVRLTEIVQIGNVLETVRPLPSIGKLTRGEVFTHSEFVEIPRDATLIAESLTLTVQAQARRWRQSTPQVEIDESQEHIVNGGIIHVEISFSEGIVAGETLDYEVELTNPNSSLGPIQNVAFEETIIIGGIERRVQPFDQPSPLEPGESLSINRSYLVSAGNTGRTLTVKITAPGQTFIESGIIG